MALRHKRRFLETSMNTPTLDEGAEWEFPDKTFDIESRYYEAECNQKLGAAVNCLPLPLRSVIEIYLERDTSLREIADVAGLSLPAVKSRLLRAKRMLRASLANEL
jgi:RNA polymerase sigma-70 factor (ECF subfamily)